MKFDNLPTCLLTNVVADWLDWIDLKSFALVSTETLVIVSDQRRFIMDTLLRDLFRRRNNSVPRFWELYARMCTQYPPVVCELQQDHFWQSFLPAVAQIREAYRTLPLAPWDTRDTDRALEVSRTIEEPLSVIRNKIKVLSAYSVARIFPPSRLIPAVLNIVGRLILFVPRYRVLDEQLNGIRLLLTKLQTDNQNLYKRHRRS